MSAQLGATRAFLSFFFLSILLAFAALLPTDAAAADTSLPINAIAQERCGSTVVNIYSFGPGLMNQFHAPEVNNLSLGELNTAEECAVITWNTNIPASVQVLYTEFENEPISIDVTAENYGYTYATAQNNSGEAVHTAILSNLKPGTVYTYRIVTRAHPSASPRISDPRVIVFNTTLQPQQVATPMTPPVATPVTPAIPAPKPEPVAKPASPVSTTEQTPTTQEGVVSEPEDTTSDETTATSAVDAVPSALNALQNGIGESLREQALFGGLMKTLSDWVRSSGELKESAQLGFFAGDRVIASVLAFVILLLLIQYGAALFGITIANKALYWLLGSGLFVILAAAASFYYTTFAAIALFLAFLAWYLMQGVPEESTTKNIPFIEKTGEKSSTKKGSDTKTPAASTKAASAKER